MTAIALVLASAVQAVAADPRVVDRYSVFWAQPPTADEPAIHLVRYASCLFRMTFNL